MSTAYAIKQQEIKKMLALSSIAQLGYILLVAMLLIPEGITASLVHVINHSVIKTGLFLAIAIIFLNNQNIKLDDLCGLGKKYPLVMGNFIILSLGLIGIPLTAGFISKWYIVLAMLKSEYWYFTIVVLITSFMTFFYIWKMIENIYFKSTDNNESVAIKNYQIACITIINTLTISFGIDPDKLANIFQQNQGTLLDLFNMFSGGALERMSIMALNIMPYITASIIMSLLEGTTPSLKKRFREEGEEGRRLRTSYVRYGTVVLALIQATGLALGLQNQGLALEPGFMFQLIAVTSLVSGTVFLMWLGELVTEKGIGNGISIIIFSSIVAGLPRAIGQAFEGARQGDINLVMLLSIALVAVAAIAFIVWIERGQRRITVNYAKRQQGRKMVQGQASYLPMKINQAGVIPAIFASSLLLFPASASTWFGQGEGFEWLQEIALALGPGQPLYVILFSILIAFFCFFYTALQFDPKEISENLRRSGAYMPGIRPGDQTADYIDGVMTRLTVWGSGYLILVCLMPQFLIVSANVPFYLGGTSLLICVVVVMDFMAQVQSHLMSHQYESLLKKANLKGYGGNPLGGR